MTPCYVAGGPWFVVRGRPARRRLTLWSGFMAAVLFVLQAPGTPTITNLVSFVGTNGAFPYAGLVQATNGNFYGTTEGGGANLYYGTVFEVTTNGVLTTLVSFDGDTNAYPESGLIEGSDGNFYGTTEGGGGGGGSGNGSIFAISPTGTLTNLALLDGANGAYPYAGLLQGTNGDFLGTANSGGAYTLGTVFQMTPSGGLTNLVSFDGTHGAYPSAGLVQGTNGDFYGTTFNGGTNGNANGGSGYGTIFEMTPAGALTTLYSFGTVTNDSGDPLDGANPYAGLIQGNDGNFYGTTVNGGTYGFGTVFRITPSGQLTNLFSFDGTNGAYPYGGLLQAADGNFYGTTYGTAPTGVVDYYGTAFRITGAGALTTLVTFDGGINGGNPYAGLVQGNDGALYGTTFGGGSAGDGVIYRIIEAPFITTQPTNQIDPPGATATFIVLAAGGFAPLSYQWQQGSAPLTNDSHVFGATSTTLIISNVTTGDQGAYSVIVRNSFGSSLASSNAALQVVVPNPMAGIASPAPNTLFSNAAVTVSGTASDTEPVVAVYYQLNGAGWDLATTTNGWTNWSASLTLATGTNMFSVYCQDSNGNLSPTNSEVLIYVPNVLLTVLVQGLGTVSPDLNGQYLPLGNTYTLSATPAAGYAFSNWTGSIVSSSPVLTFVMQSNLVLQANFVPGLFVPIQGSYSGLFHPANGISPTNSGLITLSLTSRGNFTAMARFASGPAGFVGQFSNAVALAKGIPPGQNLATLALNLQLGGTIQGTKWITGTLSDGSYTAAISAYPAGKSLQTPSTGQKLYTLAVPPGTNAVQSPGGWGVFNGRLDSRGRLSLAGTLGDGSRFSQSMFAATNGDFPLFASLYGGKGMVMGWLNLAGDAPQGDDVVWMKPSGLPRQQQYPNGFDLMTSVFGSPYATPVAGANALALTNALLVLEGGNLPGGPLTNALALVNNKAVLKANPNNLTLTLNPADGTFAGSFMPPGAKARTTLTGVVLQNQNMGVGFFLGSGQSGQVLLLGE